MTKSQEQHKSDGEIVRGSPKDEGLRRQLLKAYARKATERDARPIRDWKRRPRSRFLSLLQSEQKQNLLELGAGPGKDGRFFQENGLHVVCTDLSPEMISLCRQKELNALLMDVAEPAFAGESFDAIYSLNCLLHIPMVEIPAVLQSVFRILKSGGLFYLGVYGGYDHEGIWPDDDHEPKRFFSLYSDDHLSQLVSRFFEIHSFESIDALSGGSDLHHQSFILRKPTSP